MRSRKEAKPNLWLDGLLAHKHRNVATVALANKNARMVWAVLTSKIEFRGYGAKANPT
jgi:transposase